MERMLSNVVLTERDDYWFKNYLSVPEENELELKKQQAIDNRSFMFQNQPELQSELFDKQHELQQQRDEASLLEKAKAFGITYEQNTMVGSLIERSGMGLSNTFVDHSDYEKEDGYKNSQEFVSQVKMEIGLNNTEEDSLYNAKNPQHTSDLISSFKEKRNLEDLVNRTLSSTAQKVAQFSTIIDIDLALPLGASVAGVRGFLKVGRAGQWGVGGASGAVGASKPYLVEDTFKHGSTSDELLFEAILAGTIETLAGRFLTPELRGVVSNDMSQKVAKGIVAENANAIDGAVEGTINTPKKTREFEKKTMDAIDQELKETVGGELNKAGFKSEVAGYVHASKDIDDMFQKVTNFVLESGDVQKAKVLISGIKKEFDELFDALKKVEGLDEKLLAKMKAKALRSVDNMEVGIIGENEKGFFKNINKAATEARKNPRKLIKDGLYEPIKKAKAKVSSIALQVKLLRKQLKELGVEHPKFREASKELSKKEKELSKADDSLAKTTDIQINKFHEKKIVELEQEGVVLRFDKKTGKYNWKGRVIPTALVIGLFGGTDAFANDGELEGSVFLSAWQGFIVAGAVALLGYSAVKNLRHTKAVQARLDASLREAGVIVEEANAIEKVKGALQNNYETVRTFANETFAPLIKYAKETDNVEFKILIDKILVDPMNGKSIVGEEIGANSLRSFIYSYSTKEKELFKQWFKEQQVSQVERITESFTGKHREIFREYVASMKDGALPIPEGGKDLVKQMSEESTKLIDELGVSIAKRVGLDGVDDIVQIQDYLKRAYRQESIDLMRGMDEVGKSNLQKAFKKMYISAVSNSAGAIRSFYKTVSPKILTASNKADIKKLLEPQMENIKKLAKDDDQISSMLKKVEELDDIDSLKIATSELLETAGKLDADDIAEKKVKEYLKTLTESQAGGGVADIAGSFKKRIPLNMSSFENFSAKVGNDSVEITLKTLFERNDYNLSFSYMKQLTGRIGLKASGYSVEQAKEIISRVPSSDIRKIATNSLQAIVGNPLFDIPKGQQLLLQGLSNIALAGALPLVALSFLQEFGYLVVRMVGSPKEFTLVTKNIVDILRGHGDNSAMVTMMQKRIGLGTNRWNSTSGTRFDTDVRAGGINYSETNTAVNATRMARDTIFKASGMMALSDILELSNAIANLQRLHDVAHGLRTLNPAKVKAYGFTEKDLEIAKRFLKTNKKGHVIEPDWSKMTVDEQLRIEGLISSMGQKGAQRSTIGGTPDWTRRDAMGSALSRLVMYPTNAYANLGLHQLRGLSHGDVENSMQIFGGYAGSMIGLQLRDAVLGRERPEEDYHLYSVLNLAQLGMIGTARAVFENPAILGGGETASKMISGGWRGLTQ